MEKIHSGHRQVSQDNRVSSLRLIATLILSLASTTLHSSFTIGFFNLTRNWKFFQNFQWVWSGPRPTWRTYRRRRRKLSGASRSSRPVPASSACPSPPPSGNDHRPLLTPYSQQEVVMSHGSVLTTHQALAPEKPCGVTGRRRWHCLWMACIGSMLLIMISPSLWGDRSAHR